MTSYSENTKITYGGWQTSAGLVFPGSGTIVRYRGNIVRLIAHLLITEIMLKTGLKLIT